MDARAKDGFRVHPNLGLGTKNAVRLIRPGERVDLQVSTPMHTLGDALRLRVVATLLIKGGADTDLWSQLVPIRQHALVVMRLTDARSYGNGQLLPVAGLHGYVFTQPVFCMAAQVRPESCPTSLGERGIKLADAHTNQRVAVVSKELSREVVAVQHVSVTVECEDTYGHQLARLLGEYGLRFENGLYGQVRALEYRRTRDSEL